MAENQIKKDDLFFKPSRHAMMLRRNLMAVSALVLMALLFDVEINPEKIFGGAITGLTQEKIYFGAFLLIIYFMYHFMFIYGSELREFWLLTLIWSSEHEDSIPKNTKNKVVKTQQNMKTAEKWWRSPSIFLKVAKIQQNMGTEEIQKNMKTAGRLWRFQSSFFEIFIPTVMGGSAIGLLIPVMWIPVM